MKNIGCQLFQIYNYSTATFSDVPSRSAKKRDELRSNTRKNFVDEFFPRSWMTLTSQDNSDYTAVEAVKMREKMFSLEMK